MRQKKESKPTPSAKPSKQSKPSKPMQYELPILYAVLMLSIIGYIIFSNILLGVLAFVVLVVTIAVEFKYSVKEDGVRKSVYNILIAIVAVAVLWVILIIILGTTAPINVVASCSMLPTLHRGDLVVLHGLDGLDCLDGLADGVGLLSFFCLNKSLLLVLDHAAYLDAYRLGLLCLVHCNAYRGVGIHD